jgi:DNA topoisomerase-3
MKVTSVLGHIMEMEFAEPYGKNWNACAPLQLFEAPVEKKIRKDLEPLGMQLQTLSRRCQLLVLWLDCDRCVLYSSPPPLSTHIDQLNPVD